MIRSSKMWRGFMVSAIIFVLIFIAGMVGLLAQTTHDGVDKDKLSSDLSKEKGLFGTSISLVFYPVSNFGYSLFS